MGNKIIVFGSISTDFVVSAERSPAIGETITGQGFETTFGGKGANQAVAAARLGGEVEMVGTVGVDIFGSALIDNLEFNQIATEHVKEVPGHPSGSAHITITGGDNSIIYIPGANNQIDPARIQSLTHLIKEGAILLLQNELPKDVVDEIIKIADVHNRPVVYNPAPAREVSTDILEKADYLTPNETECQLLFKDLSISEAIAKYPKQLIVTMGDQGVYYHDGEKEQHIPAYKVTPTDTTGAGDTFNGAFALALVSGLDLAESIRFGNLAAALSIQKFGAQGGMPSLEEMKASPEYDEQWVLK